MADNCLTNWTAAPRPQRCLTVRVPVINQCLLMLALWSCGRRGNVVQDPMSAGEVARRTVQEHRGLLGRAESILSTEDEPMDGDRGAFIAFDTAKLKNAIAVAEGGRAGETRYLGGLPTHRRRSEIWSPSSRANTTRCNFVMRLGRPATGFIVSSLGSATSAPSRPPR
jgi:hypothetical protein